MKFFDWLFGVKAAPIETPTPKEYEVGKTAIMVYTIDDNLPLTEVVYGNIYRNMNSFKVMNAVWVAQEVIAYWYKHGHVCVHQSSKHITYIKMERVNRITISPMTEHKITK